MFHVFAFISPQLSYCYSTYIYSVLTYSPPLQKINTNIVLMYQTVLIVDVEQISLQNQNDITPLYFIHYDLINFWTSATVSMY